MGNVEERDMSGDIPIPQAWDPRWFAGQPMMIAHTREDWLRAESLRLAISSLPNASPKLITDRARKFLVFLRNREAE